MVISASTNLCYWCTELFFYCDNDLHWYVAVMVVIIQNLMRRRVMAPKDKTALFIHSEDFVCLANLYSPALGLNDDFDSLMPQV